MIQVCKSKKKPNPYILNTTFDLTVGHDNIIVFVVLKCTLYKIKAGESLIPALLA